MIDNVSSKPMTTVTNETTVTDTDDKTKTKKDGTTVTDRAPTVKKEETGRGDGAPPIMPPKSSDLSELMARITAIQARTDEAQANAKATQIDKNKQKMKAKLDEQLKKIDEAQKKMESQKKWGLFGKIFGGIAVGLALVAAVATGGGLAIAAASLAVALFTTETIKVGEDGKSLLTAGLEGMFKAFGMEEGEGLNKAVMWTKIGLNALVLAMSIGSAASAYKAAKAGTLLLKMPKLLATTMVFQGATSVGQGVTGAGTAVTGYQASMAQIDVKKLDAQKMTVQREVDKLIEDLKKLLEKMEETTTIAINAIGATDDSVSKQIQTMSGRA